MTDTWDPQQYEKFRRERERPFDDLLSILRAAPNLRVVDLGCGTGQQTRALHERLHARETIGIDSSPKMLKDQPTDRSAPLRFEVGTIEMFPDRRGPFDVIFSNAALHWVDDHATLLPRLAAALRPG